MKIGRMLGGTALALGMAGTALAADLPRWEPRTICTEDSAPDYCRFLENQARRDISEQWPFIPLRVREHCLRSVSDQGSESWRLMGECLSEAAAGRGVAAEADTGAGTATAGEDSSALRAELDGLKSELTRSRDRIAALEGEIEELRAVPPVADPAPDAGRITELEAALAEAEAARDANAQQVAGMNALLTAFRQSRAERDEEIATLRRSALAGEGVGDQIAELESALDKANTQVRQGEVRIEGLQKRLMSVLEEQEGGAADVAAKDDEIDALKAEIEALKAQVGDSSDDRLTEAQAALDEATTGLRRAEIRIEGLQSRLSEALEAAESSSGSDERIARLEAMIGNFRERGARVGQTVSAQRDRIRALEAELTETQAALRDAEATASSASTTVSNAAQCQAQMTGIAESGLIQFEISSADLSSGALPTLDRLIEVARTCPDARITVEGHTDSFGDPAFNQALSQLRAESVAAYMTSRGVAPSRVSAVGKGFSEPVATNDTRAGRAQNRRIEFVVE